MPLTRYGESSDSVAASLDAMKGAVFSGLGREELQRALPPGAARNALDYAFWDIDAKRAYCSVVELAGLGAAAPVETSFTLALDTPGKMAELAASNRTRPPLKLQLGGDGDVERVRAVRHAAPASRLIADANESWNEPQLSEFMPALADLRVELIERPMPTRLWLGSSTRSLSELTNPAGRLLISTGSTGNTKPSTSNSTRRAD